MNVWVTGSAGFLGTRLCRRLSREGHQVLGLSRHPDPSGVENEVLDLSSKEAEQTLNSIGKRRGAPDAIIHAAGRTKGPHRFGEFVRSNLLTTANLLDYIDNAQPPLLIHISTLSVYGEAETLPVKEDDPAVPNHPYGFSKVWAEDLIKNSGIRKKSLILRLPSLFGAGQADSFIDGLARSALEGSKLELFARGETIRDALHVEDAVEGIVSCLKTTPPCAFNRLNLGSGRPIRVLEWVEALVGGLKSTSRIIPVDRPSPQQADLYADISKARALIGFAPTPLKETFARYVQELQAQS